MDVRVPELLDDVRRRRLPGLERAGLGREAGRDTECDRFGAARDGPIDGGIDRRRVVSASRRCTSVASGRPHGPGDESRNGQAGDGHRGHAWGGRAVGSRGGSTTRLSVSHVADAGIAGTGHDRSNSGSRSRCGTTRGRTDATGRPARAGNRTGAGGTGSGNPAAHHGNAHHGAAHHGASASTPAASATHHGDWRELITATCQPCPVVRETPPGAEGSVA